VNGEEGARIFRVLVRVGDVEKAVAFYDAVLGVRDTVSLQDAITTKCGQIEFACYDPVAEGDTHDTVMSPGQSQVYFAVEDLEALSSRVRSTPGHIAQEIEKKPWGERTFGRATRSAIVERLRISRRASARLCVVLF
jgi:predicted enzyme related to lactoylglutathione lyase